MGGGMEDSHHSRADPRGSNPSEPQQRRNGMSMITTNEAAADAAECATTCSPGAELIVRERDGLVVTLFWLRATDVLLVAVADHQNGTSFELVLERNDRALDVFHHPYAYAAARGIDTRPTACEPEVELIDA
jgi:hypothetical protein